MVCLSWPHEYVNFKWSQFCLFLYLRKCWKTFSVVSKGWGTLQLHQFKTKTQERCWEFQRDSEEETKWKFRFRTWKKEKKITKEEEVAEENASNLDEINDENSKADERSVSCDETDFVLWASYHWFWNLVRVLRKSND